MLPMKYTMLVTATNDRLLNENNISAGILRLPNFRAKPFFLLPDMIEDYHLWNETSKNIHCLQGGRLSSQNITLGEEGRRMHE